MKQVLFALLVLVIAAWTAPSFAQEPTLLDQVKGKTEAEVLVFMQGLDDDDLASLIAQAINAAAAEPNNAAAVALRNVVLGAGNTVLATKSADQYNAIIAAIAAAAPGTQIAKNQQSGAVTIVPPAPTGDQGPLPGQVLDPNKKETNNLVDVNLTDSAPAVR